MGKIPFLMGVVTVVIFGVVGYSLWSVDQLVWGGICMGLGGLRLAVLIRQIYLRLRRSTDD